MPPVATCNLCHLGTCASGTEIILPFIAMMFLSSTTLVELTSFPESWVQSEVLLHLWLDPPHIEEE